MKIQKLTTALLFAVSYSYCQFTEYSADKEKVLTAENSIKYLQSLHNKNDSTDLSVASGPFSIQKKYKFSVKEFDLLGFVIVEDKDNKTVFMNCSTRELVEVKSYFGNDKLFIVKLIRFSKKTYRKVPYFYYGC